MLFCKVQGTGGREEEGGRGRGGEDGDDLKENVSVSDTGVF